MTQIWRPMLISFIAFAFRVRWKIGARFQPNLYHKCGLPYVVAKPPSPEERAPR